MKSPRVRRFVTAVAFCNPGHTDVVLWVYNVRAPSREAAEQIVRGLCATQAFVGRVISIRAIPWVGVRNSSAEAGLP